MLSCRLLFVLARLATSRVEGNVLTQVRRSLKLSESHFGDYLSLLGNINSSAGKAPHTQFTESMDCSNHNSFCSNHLVLFWCSHRTQIRWLWFQEYLYCLQVPQERNHFGGISLCFHSWKTELKVSSDWSDSVLISCNIRRNLKAPNRAPGCRQLYFLLALQSLCQDSSVGTKCHLFPKWLAHTSPDGPYCEV